MALASRAQAATVNVPFGSHSFTYASHIKPSSATQAQLDAATSGFYDNWKAAYYISGCGAGQGRINYDGANQTVSEAHGYGMLIFALMAGYDANAKASFDAMYQFYKAHPANGGATRLMAWQQNASCANINGPDTASDGDLDIAYALLLADRQWGSCGSIDYKAEGVAMINQLKAQDLDSSAKYVKLGNWATSGNYLNSTRSSDFMPDHYRSFQWATGDAAWNGLLNHTYFIITSTANAGTGLLPDFISSPLSNPQPATPNFLESADDGNYNWNACRDPWRIATDYLVSGDARAYAAAQKIAAWTKGAPINGNPANVKAGYTLPGVKLVNYGDRAFSVPFAVAAMVDASNQTLLNSFWASTDVGGTGTVDYFGDSIKMICMIVLSGNWWAPEAMPDPCAVGSPTFTPTRTATRTATRSGTPSATRTATSTASPSATRTPSPSQTPTATPSLSPAASASASPSSTASATAAGSATPSATRSGTATPTATLSASPAQSPSPTLTQTPTLSPQPSGSATASATPSATASQTTMATWTATPSATLTVTPTLSVSATRTPAPSALPSSTKTLTVAPSATGTAASSPSATPTQALPATALPTHSATPTLTAVPAPATPDPDGLLVIDQAQAWPQPNPRWLALNMEGSADSVHLELYTPAWVLVEAQDYGAVNAGWNRLPLSHAWDSSANGPYYFRVKAQQGHRDSAWRRGVLYRLR